MNIAKKILKAFDTQGKYRTMTVLRRLPENQLRDVGISPELLSKGVKAWPWQSPEDTERDYPAQTLVKPNLSALQVGTVASNARSGDKQSAA